MLTKAAAVTGDLSDALQKLRRGEITLDAYLDDCVEGAVSHLKDQLDEDALESVRESIRAVVRMDPLVLDVLEHIAKRGPELPASG